MSDDDYYVLLIIITIIGTILLIAFAIYFLYIPAIRASSTFDDVYNRGEEGLNIAQEFAQQVKITNNQVQVSIIGLCNVNNDFGDDEKDLTWGTTFDDFCENIELIIPMSCC